MSRVLRAKGPGDLTTLRSAHKDSGFAMLDELSLTDENKEVRAVAQPLRHLNRTTAPGVAIGLVLALLLPTLSAGASANQVHDPTGNQAANLTASSGSIVYIKRHNVWVAAADGKKQHQVTTDGTADLPYRSPTQSDQGVIAASRGIFILTMRQNGKILTRFDPPALMSTASHPLDGAPSSVAISADGTKIAWSYANYQCPVGTSCLVRTATGITDVTGKKQLGSTYLANPSWVTNSRTIQNGGYLEQINLVDVGGPVRYWFDDYQVAYPSTDLEDADLSPDGKWLAAVRGYGSNTQIVWLSVTGDPRSGPAPGLPTLLCETSQMAGLSDPSWSPNSDAMVWQEPDGVWLKTNPAVCSQPQPRLLIAGGSQPDWSSASLAPPPVPRPGKKPGTKVPGSSAKIKAKARPRVVGRARVGKVLRVRGAKWNVKPKVKYQWLRNRKPIKGAAKARYRLTAKDRKKRISVRVTASRPGYQKLVVVTKATAKVGPRR